MNFSWTLTGSISKQRNKLFITENSIRCCLKRASFRARYNGVGQSLIQKILILRLLHFTMFRSKKTAFLCCCFFLFVLSTCLWCRLLLLFFRLRGTVLLTDGDNTRAEKRNDSHQADCRTENDKSSRDPYNIC